VPAAARGLHHLIVRARTFINEAVAENNHHTGTVFVCLTGSCIHFFSEDWFV